MAGRYETTQDQFTTLLPKLRSRAATSGAHRRTPEIVANLAGGFGLFLAFATSTGAITDVEHAELLERSWRALGEAARAQAAHQAPAEPARRFLELPVGAMSSGRAHVAAPDGNRPNAGGGAWGWRLNAYGTHEPMGDRVGCWRAMRSTWTPMPPTPPCSDSARRSATASPSRPRRCGSG